MKIILANGKEMNPSVVLGEKRHVYGVGRDALTFLFTDMSVDELDSIFTASNCEKINIIGDDGSESLYVGYVVRVEVAKEVVMTSAETSESPVVTETQVKVTMAQRTYAESQIAALTETVDVLVMESLMA